MAIMTDILNRRENFRYTKTSCRTTRSGKSYHTTEIAKCATRGRKIKPQYTSFNLFDLRKWRTAKPPSNWPKNLEWPLEVLKAVTYDLSTSAQRRKVQSARSRFPNPNPATRTKTRVEAKLLKGLLPCSSPTCPDKKPHTRDPEDLCTCTSAPWAFRNTFSWFTSNIELRDMGPHLGIGAIARTPFAKGTVLSEYVGEVIPYDPCSTPPSDNRYTFDIMGNAAEPLACIDALHVGSWTRFINHSCKPSAEYVLKRVGREARVCVDVIREIGVGEEIKVGYGSAYWKTMEELGMWCGCEEKGCRFGEKKGRGKER